MLSAGCYVRRLIFKETKGAITTTGYHARSILASWLFPEFVATGVSGEGGCTGMGNLGGLGVGFVPLLWVSALAVPLATRPGYGCFGPGFWARLGVTCQPEMTCHLLRAGKAVNSRAPPAGGS